MPVAGQDALLNAAAIEWETHMRTAIVEREDMPAVVHEKDRAMAAVHNESPFGFQLLKGTGAHKFRGRVIHRRLIRQGSATAPFSKGASRMSIHPPTSPVEPTAYMRS